MPEFSRGRYGYIDQTGKRAIKPRFDEAWNFRERLAAVRFRKKWGYINGTGSIAIHMRFFDAGPFSEGLAPVQAYAAVLLFGFIDRSGRLVIDGNYSEVHSFCEGLAAVRNEGSWGYINRNGKMVIEPKFKWASGGIAFVIIGDPDDFTKHESIDKVSSFGSRHTPYS
jgi:WG containing repeat